MKANKALKRLAKIEALMSDVAERFSASAPHLREALKDLKAAVDSVKQAVKVQSSSAAVKKAAPQKAPSAGKRAAVKNAVAKAPKVKAAKKRALARKADKKAPPARVAPAPVYAARAAAAESMPATPQAK